MATLTAGQPGFAYLNRDNAWLDFELNDLEIVDGRLRLAALPAVAPPVTVTDAGLNRPEQPAGLAVAAAGSVFFTDPEWAEVIRVDGCDGSDEPLPCLGGSGEAPTQFRDPRGIAVHSGRNALIVADAGNHRLQLFDLDTLQLLDIWGDAGAVEPPTSGADPGRLDTPVDVAVDGSGLVYVVDRGNRRVQQFSPGGQVNTSFWQRLAADAAAAGVTIADPVNIACHRDGAGGLVFILDRAGKRLLAAGPDGRLIEHHDLPLAGDPLGLAVADDAIFMGENGQASRVVRLRRDGSVVGACPGYTGPVAALALDGRNGLLVHPGWSSPPLRMVLDAAFVRTGMAWGGPFGGFAPWTKRWSSLRATLDPLPKDAHVTFYVATTDNPGTEPPTHFPADPVEGYFPASSWSPGPDDLETFLLRQPERRYAWVGVALTGEGKTSPEVEQIRLDFDATGYLKHLPAIYAEPPGPNPFLPRYLALVEGLFADVEAEIDELLGLLDPDGAPAPHDRELARWLGLDIAPGWDDQELRDAIGAAYVEAASRGTARGLRTALRRVTGVDAVIEEPIEQAAWWALATPASSTAERETSILGVTTRLVAAEPQGAVLGSTAIVDRSHLIDNESFGTPLFEGLAHRFMVRMYQGAAQSPERLAAVEALIEREKPAHTEYAICLIEPGITVGADRLGIDTVIGGDALPSRQGDASHLGVDSVLGGDLPGAVGERSVIGVTTRLGSGIAGE